VYSRLFCGTLEIRIQDSNHKKEDDLGIKLYKIELLKFQELVSGLINLLSSTERDRANRYHFIKDKNRFIICRTLLKFFLAEHIGLEVDKIFLDSDFNKKPFLPSHPSVCFNVTHAGDYAIIAIAKSPIGVDLEYVNKGFDYKVMLPTIFDKIEIDKIVKSKEKHLTFYRFWTRKEAIVKAIGKGVDDDFLKLPVTDGFHSIPSSIMGHYENIKVFSFNLNDDYVGALALTEDIHNFDRIVFYPTPSTDTLISLFS
jgi:4'-phosphopantetheinyl transferase